MYEHFRSTTNQLRIAVDISYSHLSRKHMRIVMDNVGRVNVNELTEYRSAPFSTHHLMSSFDFGVRRIFSKTVFFASESKKFGSSVLYFLLKASRRLFCINNCAEVLTSLKSELYSIFSVKDLMSFLIKTK